VGALNVEQRLSRGDALILLVCTAALALTAWLLPDVSWERRARVEGARLAPAGGHAFRYDIELGTPADKRDKAKSYVRVLEDDMPLGPAHELPRLIELTGRGGFRHSRDHVLLSSSDGTDPRNNGRLYELAWPGHVPFVLQYLAVVAFAAFALGALPFAASRSALPERVRRLLAVGSGALVVLLALECAAKVVTSQIFLEDDGLFARSMYAQAFGGSQAGVEAGAHAPAFGPHAYLPYVLEPARTSRGVRETNEQFLIRRSEPIRPRAEVALRILAVGGSTTHDEKIAVESLTWVHQLESLLRRRHGQGVDVINGGVGGYTIYENAVHYLTLLTHLEPDVVLIFQGINDVNPRIFRNQHYDYRDYNRAWWDPRQVVIERATGPLVASHAGRLVLWLTHYQHVSQLDIHGLTRKPYPPEESWSQNLRETPPELYRRMLENFVLLVKAQGRRPVIVPQPFRPQTPRDEGFAVGLAAQNEANREVASRHDVPFLPLERLDAAFLPGDFVDNCHFAPLGAERMANTLAAFLEESGVVSEVLARNRGASMRSP
jgi:lysophospholipase L1-like esterase